MKKKVILAMVLVAILPIIFGTKVNANLQSRPGAGALRNRTASDFFIMARNMERANESFGLNATIDQANGNETSESNGIDVHMMKNTEYGTAVMLGASAYGSIPAVAAQINTNSITGNKTGMYMNASGTYTYTASLVTGVNTTNFARIVAAAQRYRNNYTTANSSRKLGDATVETQGWKGASQTGWVSLFFARGYGGVFSFVNGDGSATSNSGSRAAVVCAPGI